MQPAAAERNVELSIEQFPESLFVEADRNRLRQVLLNLLSNGIKYNVVGGSVAVAVSDTETDVTLAVRDTGKGTAAEHLDRVFEPFDRLGAETSDVAGTGLGLALSRALMDAMQGTITVTSAVDEGSTFCVTLPRAVPLGQPELERETPEASPRAGLGGRRVLYIEDNLANLALVERILEIAGGAELIPAMQGSVGVELAAAQQPDLILLDLHLPDIPGEEVLMRLSAHEQTRRIPVVVSSAGASPGRVTRLMDMGAYAYLTKPLDIQEFLVTVTEAMDGARKDSDPNK